MPETRSLWATMSPGWSRPRGNRHVEESKERVGGKGRATGAAGAASRAGPLRGRARREDLALDALRRQCIPGDVPRLARGRPGRFRVRDGGRFRHRGRGHGGACRQYPLSSPSSRTQGAGDRMDLARAGVLADRRERRGQDVDAGTRLRRSGVPARRIQDRFTQRAFARRPCGPSCSVRGHYPQAHARAWRTAPRFRLLQHHRRRMARGQGKSHATHRRYPRRGGRMNEGGDRAGPRRATVAEAMGRLPGPGGERFAEVLGHGSMEVEIYAPRGTDPQTPHTRDELYVVVSGSGTFVNGTDSYPFGPGDVLFVPAGAEHRFEDFTDDLAVWVVFYGPEGGE